MLICCYYLLKNNYFPPNVAFKCVIWGWRFVMTIGTSFHLQSHLLSFPQNLLWVFKKFSPTNLENNVSMIAQHVFAYYWYILKCPFNCLLWMSSLQVKKLVVASLKHVLERYVKNFNKNLIIKKFMKKISLITLAFG